MHFNISFKILSVLIFCFFTVFPLQSSTYEKHGIKVEDPYEHLEEMESEETIKWLDQQTLKANHYFDTLSIRNKIKDQLKKSTYFDISGIPQEISGNLIYSYKDKDQDKKCLYIEDSKKNKEVIFNPNNYAGEDNISLTSYNISPCGRKIVYGLAHSGSDFTSWHFYDLKNKKLLKEGFIETKFTSPIWDEKGLGVYYTKWKKEDFTTEDVCKGIYYHSIQNQDQNEDRAIYSLSENSNEMCAVEGLILNGAYLLISDFKSSLDKNGVILFDLKRGCIKNTISKELATFNFIGIRGNLLYFKTSYKAPNKKVIALYPSDFDLKNALEIISESKNELQDVVLTRDYLACNYIVDCKSKTLIFDKSGKQAEELPIPGLACVFLGASRKNSDAFQKNELYFAYNDFTTPHSIYKYNIKNKALSTFHEPLKRNPNFITKQVFFKSKDGTEIPMFITHHKDLLLDGKNPTLMWGYGGFNAPMLPYYFHHIPTWIEMGGIFVSVNLRGGSEYGTSWHDMGKLHNKQNVFDDFIAAAEYLIDKNYTNSKKLAINGASNGGLLVAACLVQRPELFGAVVAKVGVLDMLKFHKYTIGKFWISDYGNPEDPEDFKILHAYSPYHNIKPHTEYPPTLIVTGDHDDRVVPLHSYKFAARLQEAQASNNKIILRLNRKEGHGSGGGSTDKLLDNYADMLAFLHEELKMNDN